MDIEFSAGKIMVCYYCGEKLVHAQAVEAFIRLHEVWLMAMSRQQMNREMDNLAKVLGLDPLTLKPIKQDEPA